jgi:hypothetical protein
MYDLVFLPFRAATFVVGVALVIIASPLIVWLRANDVLDESLDAFVVVN